MLVSLADFSLVFRPEQVIQAENVRFSLVVDDARVVATAFRGMRHDIALVIPRTSGGVAHSIPDALGAASGGERHIIILAMFVEPRTFLVVLDFGVGHDGAFRVDHVLFELDHVEFRVAPVHVSLAVVVNPNGGVDVVPVFALPHKLAVQRVLEGAVRAVRYEHRDAVTVDGAVHVPFAVALDDLFRPCAVVGIVPLEIAEGCDRAVIRPVDHVGRRVQEPVVHHETVGVVVIVGRVEVHRVAVHVWGRVRRVFRCDYRMLRKSSTSQYR